MASVLERIPNAPILSYQQRRDLAEDKERLQAEMRNPEIRNKGRLRQRIQRIDRQLVTGSPPEVRPDERDELKKEGDRLLAEITLGMNSQVEQRRNPPGAVDRLIRWEKHNKPKILRWKNIVRMLDPDNPDRDLANLERFRPTGDVVGLLSDAQIAGIHTMSPQAKANWPLGEPTSQTAIAHLRKDDGDITESICAHCGRRYKPTGKFPQRYCSASCRGRSAAQKQRSNKQKREMEQRKKQDSQAPTPGPEAQAAA